MVFHSALMTGLTVDWCDLDLTLGNGGVRFRKIVRRTSTADMGAVPEPQVGLNGACLLAPDVLLAAGMAELIWRVELTTERGATPRVWLRHDMMKNRAGQMKPEQPSTNNMQFDARMGHIYCTTSQRVLLRVAATRL